MGTAEGDPKLQGALADLRRVQGPFGRDIRKGARRLGQGRASDAGRDARRVQALSQVATTIQNARPSDDGSKLTFFDKMVSTAYKMFGSQGKKIAASSPQMR